MKPLDYSASPDQSLRRQVRFWRWAFIVTALLLGATWLLLLETQPGVWLYAAKDFFERLLTGDSITP